MQYPPKAFKSCRGIHFREKSLRYGVQLIKNGKKRLSQGYDERKTAKISFPPRGKIKKRRKSAFRHGENQKTTKIGFPPRGKIKNQQKTAFPILGRIKNAIGCISQLSERRKNPKSFYLTFGVRFILTHLLVGTTP